MRGSGAGTPPVIRPAGVARGGSSLAIAWLVAGAFALLTGASAVEILLAVGLVAFLAAVLSGWVAARVASVESVTTAGIADAGGELQWQVELAGPARAVVELRVGSCVVANGWALPGTTVLSGSTPARGVHTTVTARCSTAGRLGLVWWRRTATLTIAELAVAPATTEATAPVQRTAGDEHDELIASTAPGRDDVDGVRQWRDGDEVTAVHWPSTMRSGELVVRQRLRDRDEWWLVYARSATGDADGEAARVRSSLERGLAEGARVAVVVDSGTPVVLADAEAVRRWSARFDLQPTDDRAGSWWRRTLALPSPEPDDPVTVTARWLLALAAATPQVMMLAPLGYGPGEIGVVVATIAAGAACTTVGRRWPRWLRQLCGLVASLCVAAALIDPSAINSVAASLRFLLPQVLVTLVVLQGFECNDRRAARVTLACSAMLTAYAAAIRVDAQLAAWLAVAVAGLAIASRAVTAVPRRLRSASAQPPRHTRSAMARPPLALGGGALAVLALLAVVPVPEGPAQLTLPSWLEDYRPTAADGQLVAADGSPLLGGAVPGNSRSGGGAGGYPGFSPEMDTSMRGAMSDDIVMRVRAPYPDFWRGQTFTEFDGRVWHVDDRTGRHSDAPDHRINLAEGDVASAQDHRFIQTFYAEVDMPNIVFAASRVEQVVLDAQLWARPDGSLRADVVLPAGSAYTVVSQRSPATAEGLRADGDVSLTASPDKYLTTPDSLTDRTRALATALSANAASTYDVVLAIQTWISQHVAYDLDAPVPPAGADSVDHFLFESQRGFCEQIATATAMLLRAAGIPARIATGYVPSERDDVAGVWISRARDAHAWVEVRFPSFGWVAFDPTADVPLAGEAERSTVGGELVKAVVQAIGDHLALVLGSALAAAAGMMLLRAARAWWQRRRRGRWGVLQDRFLAVALRRGADANAPNAGLAGAFDEPQQDVAAQLATMLDESAFAAAWADDDDRYNVAAAQLKVLEHSA